MYQMHVHLRNVLENLISSIRFWYTLWISLTSLGVVTCVGQVGSFITWCHHFSMECIFDAFCRKKMHTYPWCAILITTPIGSMYAIYANIGGILMVNVTMYSIHGSYGTWYNTYLLNNNAKVSQCSLSEEAISVQRWLRAMRRIGSTWRSYEKSSTLWSSVVRFKVLGCEVKGW